MRRKTIDMCNGPLFTGILSYTLPLIATGLLQLLYNSADSIVVARWAGGTALAAVSCNASLVNLIVNIFIGMSVGCSVVVSQAFGSDDTKDVYETVHTAMSLSIISGVITMAVGLGISRIALIWMKTPDDVLGLATLYLRIYFLGMPALMIYNFGAAILRAVGDTKRPLYILSFSGLLNVVLNLLFVIVFHWSVAGVAIATTVSQIVSAVLVIFVLTKSDGSYRYYPKRTHIYQDKLRLILKNGIPAGIQGSVFSLSNIIIQSSVNSFGTAAMSGNSAASTIEGFVYVAMNSFYQTCMSFTAQNVGARRIDRVRRVFVLSTVMVAVVGLVLGISMYIFGAPLLTLFTASSGVATTISAEEIIFYGMKRLSVISVTYCLCGIMDVATGGIRGMGSPWKPMISTICGICGIRIVWIFTVFKYWQHTLESLYFSYTVSWLATWIALFVFWITTYRSLQKKFSEALPETKQG